MWVAPEARGSGAGQALLDAVVAWARERGLGTLELWVTESNSSAARLYRRAGFVETGARAMLRQPRALHRPDGARDRPALNDARRLTGPDSGLILV
ncbi:MAG: GNAT family N-acetyltransferase, partial [Candidatus Rokuibacteriota bacterium]